MHHRIAAIVLPCVLAACATNATTATTATNDGFTLTVDGAHLEWMAGTIPARSGDVFVEVDVTLANVSDSTPIPDELVLYSLTTTDAVIYPASADSALLTPTCNVSVAEHGQTACRLAFEVPITATATAIDYTDPVGARTASAPIANVAPLAQCQTWTRSTDPDCMTCVDNDDACEAYFIDPVNEGGTCSECVDDFSFDSDSACTARPTGCTPSAACLAAIAALNTCIEMQCNRVCE